MSGFYGIPGLQAVTTVGNSTTNAISFNGPVDLNNTTIVNAACSFKVDADVRSSIKLNFGDSLESSISFNGTDLVLDTITTGFGGRVFVGDGFNGGALISGSVETFHQSLGSATPNFSHLLIGDYTGSLWSIGAGINLVHNGSTVTVTTFDGSANHNGTAANQTVTGGNFLAVLSRKNSSTATVTGVNGKAQLAVSAIIGAGTTNIQNKFEVTGSGGAHTAGTVYSRTLWATEPPTLTGVSSFTGWAGLFSGDTQINSNKKLLLEGSDTVKGDTYLIYDTAATELQMYVNGTKVLGSTSTTLTAYIGTAGFGGGGGGSANSVTTTVDFGASFNDKAQSVVTGQTWVAANTEIVAHIKTPSGTDPDEMYLINPEVVISDIVPGTGFTVTVYTEAEAKGTYDVMCIGV